MGKSLLRRLGPLQEASWKRPQGWRGTTENKTSDKERGAVVVYG